MKRLLLLIFNLLAISTASLAQSDSLNVSSDSAIVAEEIPVKKRFVAPSFTFDYGKTAMTLAGFEDKLELGLSFLFYEQFYLTGEYGQATLNPENAIENGYYQSEGNYLRIGGGYLTNIDQKNKLGFGAVYAQSSFSDQWGYFVNSKTGVQSDFSEEYNRPGLSARWVELIITSETQLRLKKSDPESKLNKLFSAGMFIRLRLLSYYDKQDSPVDIYAIPGYGKVINDPVPAINLYLRFHPF
jgi:hypothetical protein